MKLRRIISIILAVCLISSACLISASAADTKWEPKNEQPFIFVHGLNGWGGAEDINGIMPYWGATTGDLMHYLQNKGYDCYSASVGPLNSAWTEPASFTLSSWA